MADHVVARFVIHPAVVMTCTETMTNLGAMMCVNGKMNNHAIMKPLHESGTRNIWVMLLRVISLGTQTSASAQPGSAKSFLMEVSRGAPSNRFTPRNVPHKIVFPGGVPGG